MLKQKIPRKRQVSIPSKKVSRQVHLYSFPTVQGLEDVFSKLNSRPAEDVFCALLHAFALRPITDDECAFEAERMIEYLDRAFEKKMLPQVKHYHHILFMLLKEYDDIHHIRTSKDMPPHKFLKALLIEDKIPQKSLVPDYFYTESQVSEFLHQKKGRNKLSYKQAASLGKKFKVDLLNFL
jgi:hypothetical protein